MFFLCLAAANFAVADNKNEDEWTAAFCRSHSAADKLRYQTEYRLGDGTRADCFVSGGGGHAAVETEFSHKWAEALGQSLHYGMRANAASVIVLIKHPKTSQLSYIRHLKRTQVVARKLRRAGIPIFVLTPRGAKLPGVFLSIIRKVPRR